MQWILEHFQFVVIVAIAFASWLKNRMDAKKEAEETYDPREVFGEPDDVTWEAPNAYPPPLSMRPAPPPLPAERGVEAVAEAWDGDAVLKHQQELAERLRQIREARATTSGGAAATRAREARKQAKAPFVAAGPVSLRQRLQDPRELRRAFITREILDRPVSLR